jgi:hypothetical protein
MLLDCARTYRYQPGLRLICSLARELDYITFHSVLATTLYYVYVSADGAYRTILSALISPIWLPYSTHSLQLPVNSRYCIAPFPGSCSGPVSTDSLVLLYSYYIVRNSQTREKRNSETRENFFSFVNARNILEVACFRVRLSSSMRNTRNSFCT